ncbi:ATP-binding protein [Lentzea tibetensis]|uniref:ATP-binding protein n=1 Tax=Lentzea tibetensis TaxID=2591470 RepID=A0A563EXE3_9PSEU|nr:ATP-binding protein [Lentzea tibetensis]TWP52218.1 ATP-binding protein [Lentzea tibetensis]
MTNELALEFPAHSRQVAAVRHQVASWLDDAGLDDDSVANLVLAVSEAVSNAVEHAYQGPMKGRVQLRAEVTADGAVCVAVTDRGRWRPRPATLSSRGRGLLLMRENVDQVIVDRALTGTTVTLRLASHPVLVPLQEGPRVPVGHEVLVHEASGQVEVVVRGNVPGHAGPTLRRTLSTLARGGSVPLTVDLAEFVGQTDGLVHALHAVAEVARAAGNRLTVHAPRQAAARAAVEGLSAVVDLRS